MRGLSNKKSGAENHSNIVSETSWKCELKWMTLLGISVTCLMLFSGLFSVSVLVRDIRFSSVSGFSHASAMLLPRLHSHQGSENDSQESIQAGDNVFLGLLAKGFQKQNCLSRHQASLYRKVLSYNPSSYLVSNLRAYEALHQRCGPHTESYNRSLKLINISRGLDTASDCNYLVWISSGDLSNKILSITSAFLYAVLTNRVLLIDRGIDIDDLFCEPFPDTSWLLPVDFLLSTQFQSFDKKSRASYGNMLRKIIISNSTSSYPSSLYLHLADYYDDYDKLFFCDENQRFLRKVPWLIMKTDNYFIPSLFLIPSFQQQLHNIFPQKETVFHFLGRYLFHPTNSVWGLITRYYDAYLAKADEKVGIQLGAHETSSGHSQHVLDEIMACVTDESLVWPLNELEEVVNPDATPKLKTLLITSLNSGYSDSIKNMYWEKPTVNGEIVSVYQPSHDGFQQQDKLTHNRKAFAEMYLLSLTDVLVTSSSSTFGYVAQGFGGLRPWILIKPENGTVPNPPCRRAVSMEPCFHAPPFYDCKVKSDVDTGTIVPYVRHCEDVSRGLKLVDV